MDSREIRAPSFFDGLEKWRWRLYPRRGKHDGFSPTKIECWSQLFSHFCLKKSRSLSLPPSLPLTRPTSLPPSLAMNGKLKLNFSSFLVSPVAAGQPSVRPGRENLLVARSLSFAVIFTAAAINVFFFLPRLVVWLLWATAGDGAATEPEKSSANGARAAQRWSWSPSLFCPFISSRRSIVILAKTGKRKLVRLRLLSPLSLSLSFSCQAI